MVKIADLEAELAKGRIYEATLITDDAHLEGMCDTDTGKITIDPKVSIVSALLHELIHRKYPRWSEKRVEKAEIQAMSQLTQRDVQKWYRRYKRAVRKCGPVDAVEYV